MVIQFYCIIKEHSCAGVTRINTVCLHTYTYMFDAYCSRMFVVTPAHSCFFYYTIEFDDEAYFI